MAVSGRELTKDHSLEELIEVFIECHGRVKEVAKRLGCSHNPIYNYLDIYPELQEARRRGSARYLDRKVEAAEEVLEKITDSVEIDAVNAGKQAQFILKNAKISPYYEAKKEEESISVSPILLKELSEFSSYKAEFKEFLKSRK
jgi:hypothetical protein